LLQVLRDVGRYKGRGRRGNDAELPSTPRRARCRGPGRKDENLAGGGRQLGRFTRPAVFGGLDRSRFLGRGVGVG
jgi:hypothetical protein